MTSSHNPYLGLFAFAGTRSRGAYLRIVLAVGVIAALCVGLLEVSLMAGSPVAAIAALVVALPLMWMSYAVGTQRCRDAGLSPWMILLMVVPIANYIFAIALLLWPGRDRIASAPSADAPAFEGLWRFSGRRGRKSFIQHRAAGWVAIAACFALTAAGPVASLVALAGLLATWISLLAVATQRLRDLGLNGWWALAMIFMGPFGAVALMLPPSVGGPETTDATDLAAPAA